MQAGTGSFAKENIVQSSERFTSDFIMLAARRITLDFRHRLTSELADAQQMQMNAVKCEVIYFSRRKSGDKN